MYSLDTLLVISLVTLLFGLGLGALLGRIWLPKGQQRNLEEMLDNSRQEYESYQHEVAKHFVETSARIKELTQSYKELHEHLARGAANLASPDISRELLEAASSQEESKVVKVDELNLEPPRDWAPKAPGQKGTLSEDYGLRENDMLTRAPIADPRISSR